MCDNVVCVCDNVCVTMCVCVRERVVCVCDQVLCLSCVVVKELCARVVCDNLVSVRVVCD